MYKLNVPYHDFNGKAKNKTVCFNLTEREVFKLLKEFQLVFNWKESIQSSEIRELDTGEVIEFYNAFEEILLAAWGMPTDDGEHFRKSGRYEFEESAVFAAAMVMFVTDPKQTTELIDGIMPKGMAELVTKADENLAAAAKEETNADLRRQIEELRAQMPAAKEVEGPAAG